MKTTATTTAVAAVLFALIACGDVTPPPDVNPPETPEVTAALDWIEAADMEFGAAPFSPPGWPYRIGDELDTSNLDERFPAFFGIRAVTWVDGRAFGAVFGFGSTKGSRVYGGHFPKKVRRSMYESWRRRGMVVKMELPPGGNVELALGDRFEAARQGLGFGGDPLDVLRARWHEPFLARIGKDGGR